VAINSPWRKQLRRISANEIIVRPWLVAAVWVGWFVLATRLGYARYESTDKVDRRATTISVLADLITVVSLLGALAAAVLIPSAALPVDPWLALALGSALVVLGIGLRQWAAKALGVFFTRSIVIRAEHRVVRNGPYRFVRHPAYAGDLVSVLGLALTLGNWLSIMIAVSGFFLAHVPRIRAEEAALDANFGEDYRAFAGTRKRLIPGVW
jgi:protein-S-isoprenylcysteine O-methyltransferase Ste14